jgi:hypothetical protein
MKFSYQWQKLSEARSCLMLPHQNGEAHDIATAFHACYLGLSDFDLSSVDEDQQRNAKEILNAIDTSAIPEKYENGRWNEKALRLSTDEKLAFSKAVDNLASYFGMEMWSSS